MTLTKKEKDLADECLRLMKKHDLKEYTVGDLELTIVPEAEHVKVRKIAGPTVAEAHS